MRRFAAALAALLLSACASLPPPSPATAGMASPAGEWRGKLGYRVEADATRRAQAGSALFELAGDAGAGSLRLSSPLGSLLAEAQWGPTGLRLRDERGQRDFGSLAELGAALGASIGVEALPLDALFDWLQGRPSPAAASRAVEGGFEQLGWQVQTETGPPQRLRLNRERLSLTLILNPA